MAPFLLLFLLFSLPQSTEGVACCQYCTCLHFVTCYRNAKPKTTAWLGEAEEASWGMNCPAGVRLSKLQVVSPSVSTLNVSFDSDIASAYFYYEKGSMHKIEGEGRGQWHTVNLTEDFKTFGKEPTINIDGQISSVGKDVPFWPNVTAKVPCDPALIRDTCNNGDCDKVLTSPRSVSCKSSFQLHLLSSSSGQRLPVTAVSCQAARWNFVLSGNKIDVRENKTEVICRKAEMKPTSAPIAPTVSPTFTAAPPKTTAAPAATSSPPSSATQKAVGDAKREAKEGHPSNKWLWIGGAIALVVVGFAIVAACIVYRSRRSKKAAKNKKTAGGNKKNKGGKTDNSSTLTRCESSRKRAAASSSNQPSTSESKYDQDKQEESSQLSSQAPPSESGGVQPRARPTAKSGEVSVCPTTNLEMLKTEML